MAGQEGPEKELWMSGCLVPCTGRHTPVEEVEDEEEVVLMSKSMAGGRARPIRGRHGPAVKEKEEAVTGAKRKAETAEKVSAFSSDAGKVAVSPDPSAGYGEENASGMKWVEMPIRHVRWILAQKRENHPTLSIEDFELYRTNDPVKSTAVPQKIIDANRERFSRLFASLKESHDDFFKYQDWVRKVFARNGCVMVPENVVGPRPELQEEIDKLWAQLSEEYDRENPDSDTEDEENCASTE